MAQPTDMPAMAPVRLMVSGEEEDVAEADCVDVAVVPVVDSVPVETEEVGLDRVVCVLVVVVVELAAAELATKGLLFVSFSTAGARLLAGHPRPPHGFDRQQPQKLPLESLVAHV